MPYRQSTLEIGDTGFFAGDRGGEAIVDAATLAVPQHPERLRAELLPEVVAAYREMET
jgi:hypothetical protein